jgi:hypothetical protein
LTKLASQPKWASASSGLMLTTGTLSPRPCASAMAYIRMPSSSSKPEAPHSTYLGGNAV